MDLKPLFQPQSIAVVGVSLKNERHPANVIYKKLRLRYPVTAYPVNPKGGSLMGDRVYTDVTQIPETIDLVVVAVRSKFVPSVVEQSIQCGAGGAIVISGGFSEVGNTDLQDQLVTLATENNFPVIGPNCLGVYSPDKFDSFFLPGQRLIRPDAGHVAFVSQSGGVLVDQMVKFSGQGVGLSLGVSIGNKAVLRELDFLEYLAADPATKVIAFYVEGFRNGEGRQFVQRAQACGKPVIMLKAGKSAAGSRAASSHTASLAGDYSVFSQVLAQHGIAEAKSEFELISFCESLECYNEHIGNRVGIITVSGGHGVLAVDECAAHGLQVPILSAETQADISEQLSKNVRSIASLSNPIDLTGSATDEDFIGAVTALSRCPDVDSVLILLLPYSPGISSDLGARLSYVYQEEGLPLVAYVPHEDKYRMLIEGFELNRIPVSNAIDGAVLMIEALRRCQTCQIR